MEISELIAENLHVDNMLREASKKWDGGYVIAGLVGPWRCFCDQGSLGYPPCILLYER